MTRHSQLVRAAAEYAANGFDVFPLQPSGKRPLRAGWQRLATRDPERVRALWAEAPEANVGVRSGGGLVVLDADTPDAFDGLDLPETTTVQTLRGQHRYYLGDAPSRAGIRTGLDVRGRGGHVVGAGSFHSSGARYRWVVPPWELPPEPAPSHVLALARARAERRSADDQGPIPHGRRNDTLTRRAGRMRAAGLDEAEILGALLATNQRCVPPLDVREVERIAHSIGQKEGAPLWAVDPARYAEDSRLDSNAHHLLLLLATRARADGTVRGGEWLAKVTGLSRNTVGRAAAQLTARERLEVRRVPRQANLYRLLPPTPSGTACTTQVQREGAAR